LEVAVDVNYMLACGIVWRKTTDPEAGWELVEGLQSSNPDLRLLAHIFLVETGKDSMDLLEGAVARGDLSPEVAGPCMAEILRSAHAGRDRTRTVPQHLGDVLLR
jgi:hypothetical protein